MDDSIAVQLTRSQAFVLFEWLAQRTTENAAGALTFDDPAERDVLWALEGKLEQVLPEVLAPDYHQRLADARAAVRGHPEG